MARFTLALAGVSALAIALPAAAQAQGMAPVHGTVSGQYADVDSADAWTGDLGIIYNGGIGLGGQANIGFGTIDFGGGDADIWGIGGGLIYGFDGGKVGGGVQYQSLDLGFGFDGNVTNYGAAGEAYMANILTLAGRIGGFSGTGNLDGFYVGGGAAVYPMANLALKADIDYADADGGDFTSYGVGAEFLPFPQIPVSIAGGYKRIDVSGFGGEADVWRISLKAYLGTPGNGTLIETHRNGALNFGNVIGIVAGQ